MDSEQITDTWDLVEGRWYLLNGTRRAKFMKRTSTDMTTPTIDVVVVNLIFMILTDYDKEPELEVYINRSTTDGEKLADFSIKSCALIENQGFLCVLCKDPNIRNVKITDYNSCFTPLHI